DGFDLLLAGFLDLLGPLFRVHRATRDVVVHGRRFRFVLVLLVTSGEGQSHGKSEQESIDGLGSHGRAFSVPRPRTRAARSNPQHLIFRRRRRVSVLLAPTPPTADERSIEAFEDSRGSHSAAVAHRPHRLTAPAPPQLEHGARRVPGPRAADLV